MQKIILLLLALLTMTVVITAGTEPEGIILTRVPDGYIVSFNLPAFRQSPVKIEGEDFTRIEIPSYGTTSESGLPSLPLVSFNLAIPYSMDKAAAEVLSRNEQTFQLSSKVFPFQEPWPKDRPAEERPFSINREYYTTGGKTYPFVSLSESYVVGGVKGITVVIHPFAYNPSTNKLTRVMEGQIMIKVTGGTVEANRSPLYDNYLREIFLNYDAVSADRGIKYLIITAPEYESGLLPFVNHKTAMGYTVDLFNTGATGTTTTAIKSFIQQRYDNPLTTPEFVLLVGDADKIPAWTGSGLGSPKTDLNYACLEGTDYFADVFIGRFSVATAAQLQSIINKTIYMENNIAAVGKKSIFMASTDNYAITEGTHNFVIDNYFQPNNYASLKLYTYTYGATTSQLIAALNDNQRFAVYSGHGSTTSWADGPPLNQTQVRALTNTIFPYVYSFACITGDYANTSTTECFGETWIRTTTGGASFYGSSVNSYWDEDDILERVLFKAMFVDNLTKVTPMFDKAKVYFVNHYGSITSMVLRYLEMYNLMGDPSIETVMHIQPDTTAPEAITNLSVLNPCSNSLTLNWTAPYDSTFGGIAAYDIRYSTSPINEGNFNSAPQRVLSGQSDTAGTPKSFKIDSLNFNTAYYAAVKAKDMWGNTSPISNVPTLSTLAAPQVGVSPDSLAFLMTPDSVVTDTIFISNTAGSPSTLDYTVELANNTFPGKLSVSIMPLIDVKSTAIQPDIKKEEITEGTGMSIKGHGGPDAFGYKWKDSDEPNGPQYIWNSIVSTGTQVTNWIATGSDPLDDGYVGPINIGFSFKYYGEVKTQLYITTNGLITFIPVTSSWITNANIPNSAAPNSFIAPMWDDLDGRYQGTVHYKQETDRFIIQYTNWQKYNASSSSYTFQLVLNKNGRIEMYYNNLVGDLSSCTVGIENPAGTTGLPVTYNAAYLANNRAIHFAAEPEWLFPGISSGTITSGNTAAFLLQVNTDGLEFGNYSMDVIVKSNCPVHPSVTVPVHLTVTNDVPVELASFTAEAVNGTVLLKWDTRTETNNSGFRIERSSENDAVWKEMGFVRGSGTTTEPKQYAYTDRNVVKGIYRYRLVQTDLGGSKSVSNAVEVEVKGPESFELSQNYPNPFNPSTKIRYAVPVPCRVRITVHNLLGEAVSLTEKTLEAGYYEYTWDGSAVSSGIYIYSMDAVPADGSASFRSLRKMVLIK